MTKHDDRTYGKGVEYVKCPTCKYEHPISPDYKIQSHGAICARCGEHIPELDQYVVEEPKPVEPEPAVAPEE